MITSSRIHAFIDSRRRAPFAWGTHDCATFAADACIAFYGVDPMGAYRHRYSTAQEAIALCSDLLAAVGEALIAAGFTEIAPTFATTGDIVVVMNHGRECCGVHLGDCIAAPGATGLRFLPPYQTIKAWRAK